MTPKPQQVKVRRLPKEKRMTICIGILSNEGIVIAADTQETAGDVKREENKIFSFAKGMPSGGSLEPPPICGILTGAGDAGYLDTFTTALVTKMPDAQDMNELEAYLSDTLREFHEHHLWPLSQSPEPPEIEILAALTCKWSTSLFVSRGSTIRRSLGRHAAIGYGAHFARGLLNSLPFFETIKEAQVAAAIVAHATKEQIEYCGKETSICSLRQCVWESTSDGKIVCRQPDIPMEIGSSELGRAWEFSFEKKWKDGQKKFLLDLIAEESKSIKS